MRKKKSKNNPPNFYRKLRTQFFTKVKNITDAENSQSCKKKESKIELRYLKRKLRIILRRIYLNLEIFMKFLVVLLCICQRGWTLSRSIDASSNQYCLYISSATPRNKYQTREGKTEREGVETVTTLGKFQRPLRPLRFARCRKKWLIRFFFLSVLRLIRQSRVLRHALLPLFIDMNAVEF